MALARVHNWVSGEVLYASDLNAEFNNLLVNSVANISPVTTAIDFNGTQLINARLEVKTATAPVSGAGRIYWQSSEGAIHVDTGTVIARTPAIVGLQEGFLLGSMNPTAISGATVYGMVQLGAGLTLTGTALTATVADQVTGLAIARTSATSLTVAIGACASDDTVITNRILMNLPTATVGTFASTWVVGTNQPKLDAGTIAASTSYHIFVIEREDTHVVDWLLSASPTAPTLPASYTKQRRIGSRKTNASSQFDDWTQDGDYVRLSASVLDINTTNPGTLAVTANLASIPTGVAVMWLGRVMIAVTASSAAVLLSDMAATDEAPTDFSGTLAAPGQTVWFASTGTGASGQEVPPVRTNTAAQIRYRMNASDANTKIGLITYGWMDRRGRG